MEAARLVTILLLLASPVDASLLLQWTHDTTKVIEYRVLRQSQGAKGFTHIATLPADARTWQDNTTRRNRTYWYQVVAIWAEDDRQFSNVASGRDR